MKIKCMAILTLVSMSVQGAVTFDWVTVGNEGNAADTSGYGAVAYVYRIAAYEVTNAQYTEFLNAKAATDNFGGSDPRLYDFDMGTDPRGGITRSGSSGSYTYSTRSNMADKPVNFVSFFDSMRFVNWLENGQGNGSTESGVYTIGTGASESRSGTASFYGGFDFGGNVQEWNEAITFFSSRRGRRGGNYAGSEGSLRSSALEGGLVPAQGFDSVGFRVASSFDEVEVSAVPEPETLWMILLSTAILSALRKRKVVA